MSLADVIPAAREAPWVVADAGMRVVFSVLGFPEGSDEDPDQTSPEKALTWPAAPE